MSYVFPRRGVGALAFGAIDFNASTVWNDWVAGANGDNAAGKRAAQAVQAGLNEIGYGPLTVDGQFGQGSIAKWNKFAADTGVKKDWPDQAGIIKLGEQLSKGGDQGGGGQIDYHVVDGQYVTGSSPGKASKAGTGMLLGLGVAALAAVGILALVAKKRKTGATSTGLSHRAQESALKA